VKIIRNGKGFEPVEVTKDDQKRIRQELRQTNVELMEQCFGDANRIVLAFLGAEYGDGTLALIATQLLDKLANKQFSEEQQTLTKKIHWMKEEFRASKETAQGQYDPAAEQTAISRAHSATPTDSATSSLLLAAAASSTAPACTGESARHRTYSNCRVDPLRAREACPRSSLFGRNCRPWPTSDRLG